MEYIHCALCGADDTKLVFKRKDLTYHTSEHEFCAVRCRQCGLVYVNPRPTLEEIHAYYPEEFYDTQINAGQLLHEKEQQLLLKYQYVKNLRPGTLLDVGCSKGEFLFFMQQKGWEVHGIDFSTKPPNVFGLDIVYGDFEAAGYKPESFDLVTLWAVLEHMYEPKQVLLKVQHVIKPGGKIVLLVTNFKSLPAWLMRHDDIPRHTTLFTKRTLRDMLRRTGFTPDGFSFNCALFGGHNRGVLNYVVKRLAGEPIQDIVEQNRSAGKWRQFSSQLRGRDSRGMLKVDSLDRAIMPYLDCWLDRLHCGFIMIARATKVR
jgi:SAM-dependent methyltransferase